MSKSRRDFIRTSALVGVAAAVRPADLLGLVDPAPPRALKILILGGTGFIGPHQVNYALSRGHEVAIFNRGRTNPDMFKGKVEQLTGDRANNLESLKGRKWDAVIDNSAARAQDAPEWLKLSAEVLKGSVNQYLFISTRSVYKDTSRVPMTADAPTLTMADLREGQARTYGVAKAEAERAAHAILPGRVTVVRPGLIIGPGDDTDRYTYWPLRIARGGEILAPGDGTDRVQQIDVRDLDEFVIKLVEDRTYGVFNAVGPQGGTPFKEWLERQHKALDGKGTYTWVDTDWLIEQKVRPYVDLPVWQPGRGATAGFARFDLTPEIKAGLKFRPIELTARDTLAWFRTLPAERQAAPKAGMKPEREKELLALWHARAK